MNAAYLWPQLEIADEINNDRLKTWHTYYNTFLPLKEKGVIELQTIPDECVHNAHMFWIKFRNLQERTEFLAYMRNDMKIGCVFHYVPLHSSKAGMEHGRFFGEDRHTTAESERLVRFPLFYGIQKEDLDEITALAVEWINNMADL